MRLEDMLLSFGKIKHNLRSSSVTRLHQELTQTRRSLAAAMIDNFDLRLDPTSTLVKHVLFLVVDCLRADHTSLHGYFRDTTPFDPGERTPLENKEFKVFLHQHLSNAQTGGVVVALDPKTRDRLRALGYFE